MWINPKFLCIESGASPKSGRCSYRILIYQWTNSITWKLYVTPKIDDDFPLVFLYPVCLISSFSISLSLQFKAGETNGPFGLLLDTLANKRTFYNTSGYCRRMAREWAGTGNVFAESKLIVWKREMKRVKTRDALDDGFCLLGFFFQSF